MARYQTDTFVVGPVGAGGILDYDRIILSNTIDISKIKIVPSVGAGTQEITIYGKAARADSDVLWKTDAWTAAQFTDPADDLTAEFNQGWIVPYYDVDEGLNLHFRFKNNHAAPKTFTVTINYEYLATGDVGVIGAPEDLYSTALADGLKITSGCIAARNDGTITQGEFRATYLGPGQQMVPQDMRTIAEGGTWVPDGVTKILAVVNAGPGGAQYVWTSASQGRWYFSWRLLNSVGWSRWTDGNTTPIFVTQWVDTQASADIGPPSDWEVWIEEGPSTGTIVVHVTKPKSNGKNLLWFGVQVKDGDIGAWIPLDSALPPASLIYDGSLISHTLSADKLTISKAAGGWGAAQQGDLILLDVRGGNFNVNYCQWGTVDQISGSSLIFTTPGWRPQTSADLRLKIVKHPARWIGGGYLGSEENFGMWPSGEEASASGGLGLGWIANNQSEEFVTTPIRVPSAVTNPEVRVWFENLYCRSDDNIHSSGMSGGTGILVAPLTLSDFNNRNLWLPIYPPSTWGTLDFESDGSVTAETAASQSTHRGQSGVRGRFRLYPDLLGTIMITARWTGVVFPVGLIAADRLALGVELFSGRSFNQLSTGICLTISGIDPANLAANALYNTYRINTTPYENMPFPGALNIARPADGSIVEMRVTLRQRAVGGRHFCADVLEFRFGGVGPWTTKAQTWNLEGWGAATNGLEMFIGWIGNCRLTGTTAKLVEVIVSNGIAEVY